MCLAADAAARQGPHETGNAILKPPPFAESESAALKPPLKWAGGKRWLAPHMRLLWQAQRDTHSPRRLVEPFCGGLAVALALRPQRALLCDINPHLINFYRWLQKGLRFDVTMHNDSTLYYAHRERFNALIAAGKAESEEAAQLFYYLNRTGYNGLCRFNSKGGFNVPFGRYKTINYATDFSLYAAAFADWEFRRDDFEQLPVEPDDFVYADPPYDVPFTQYSKEGFDWSDQVRLAKWLARHRGPVALSNQATERVVALYQSLGFALRFLDAPRRVSCTGDRTPAREVLATRNLASGPHPAFAALNLPSPNVGRGVGGEGCCDFPRSLLGIARNFGVRSD